MEKSESPWIQVPWEREKEKAQEAMLGLGNRIEFDGGNVILEGERLEGTRKEAWGKVRKIIKKETESNRINSYRKKELQSESYRK